MLLPHPAGLEHLDPLQGLGGALHVCYCLIAFRLLIWLMCVLFYYLLYCLSCLLCLAWAGRLSAAAPLRDSEVHKCRHIVIHDISICLSIIIIIIIIITISSSSSRRQGTSEGIWLM